MKKGLVLGLFLFLASVSAEAQICGRINGTIPVPTVTVPPGCVAGIAVSRGGVGLFKIVRNNNAPITSILLTPLGDADHDFIITVRKTSLASTVMVRTYVLGRTCSAPNPIETACLQPFITQRDSDFSFEVH